MSDFFQNGVITTFHRLGTLNVEKLEDQLKSFSRIRPIALVLPSLYREYASGALPNIMKTLKKVTYLNEIVLCLDKATSAQFKEVKETFSSVKKLKIIWNDGKNIKKLYQLLERHNLSPGDAGLWVMY